MRFVIHLDGRERAVEVKMSDGRPHFLIDARPAAAEAVEIRPGHYSILLEGRSYEVRVRKGAGGLEIYAGARARQALVRDPRRRRRSETDESAAGPQHVSAPMPGKVIRVLVEEGQAVNAGHGLLVVEAMKMQNEIKSPKAGVVSRVLARPGAAVNAGETLVVVE